MSITTLIIRELKHRKLGAIIAVLTITIALTTIIASLESIHRFDTQTESQLQTLKSQADATTAKMNNDIRRTMKGLGFNVQILPANQDLTEVYSKGYASATMPQDYVQKLADSPIVTINHLLPQLSRRILWKEQNTEVMLIGVDGQVPFKHRNPKKPIMQPVPTGTAVIGSELAKTKNLTSGQKITFNGKQLTIQKIHQPRGTIDDITIWIPLATTQELLNLPGRINTILALGCNCTTVDRLGEIRKELTAILPDTKIIEIESKALARAEARNKVAAEAKKNQQNIIENRNSSRAERTKFLAILTPLILIGSLIGLFTLTLLNTRERRSEIGTLLSIGIPNHKILALFLGRTLIIGILGAALTAITITLMNFQVATHWKIIILAPLLTLIAAWIPTLIASRQDPVTTLRAD